ETSPRGLAYVNGRLWASYDTAKLYELDAATGQVIDSFTAPLGASGKRPFGLAFDGQALWLIHFGSGIPDPTNQILRMDISAPTPQLVTLTGPDQTVSGVDFGLFQLGSASGRV